jgi:DNA invertase Pin-like site-specific DNA recombinase
MAHLAGYIRVSKTAGKAKLRSPAEQRKEIEGWAKAHGHSVDFLPEELDRKGDDAARPILRRAIDGIVAGDYAGIVVAYLSRAGRDLRLMLDMWAEVEGAGGVAYFARENIDGSTNSGRLHRNILASIAQHELEERRDGFARVAAAGVAEGIWPRRQTPLGYRRDSETRRLVPDKNAERVRRAFRTLATGTPVVTIARKLGMTPTGAKKLLRNRVYLGELRIGQDLNPAAHKPLVTVEEFETVQEILDRGASRPARKVGEAPALLAGLARCASCGHLMSRRAGRKYTYSCNLGANTGRCEEWASVSMDTLDRHVEAIALAEFVKLAVTATPGQGVEKARAAFDAAERELAEYVTAISPVDVGAAVFNAGARARKEKVEQARAAMRAELAKRPALPVGVTGAEVWETLNGHERNTLLRGLLAAVVVKRAGGRGSRVALGDRVRVLAHGSELAFPGPCGNDRAPVVPIALPNLDSVGVLSLPLVQDAA